jgi:uncharacterized protein
MRYWDASALVPLVVAEELSETLRRLAKDGDIVTWSLSAVEITAAIERRSREEALTPTDRQAALQNLAELRDSWTEITGLGPVSSRACRLLGVHPLRAADALQLGAALVATGERPQLHEFVCTDRRLCDAAAREGFRLAL